MSGAVKWEGLEELKAELRRLPEDLTGEASHIVEGAANAAAADIRQGYGRKMKHPGELQTGVTVTHFEKGKFSAGAIVKNSSKLAWIFENGTQARHYVSSHGVRHLVGKIPPLHVMLPVVIRRRAAMYTSLKEMLVRHGLIVCGESLCQATCFHAARRGEAREWPPMWDSDVWDTGVWDDTVWQFGVTVGDMAVDSSLIENALIAKLGADAALLAICQNGIYFDEAPPGSTKFVIVSLVDEVDEAQFGGRAYESALFQVEARVLSTAGANVQAAAARIDALLEDQQLSVAGYTWMTMHRESRIRITEVDEQDPSVRWLRRGGNYRVEMAVV